MEKVIVVAIKYPNIPSIELNNSLQELSRLINTAGGEVVETVIQKRDKPDPSFLIGSGKATEIANIAKKYNIRAVVFNNELTFTQQRNLEEVIDAKIIDRTRLILDIFAYRARTKEGILQVELAQLNYYLPRLTKRGIMFDNQVGGIGARGPGERKLEYDRRKIRDRIAVLNREINKIQNFRTLQRQKRISKNIPIVSLIGYTNAGKSTLLNTLTKCSPERMVYADDKLFATLDPTIRRLKLPSGRFILISDTVGFIRNLPHQLIAAFRATLEEIKESDCLIHVIDVTSNERKLQESVVMQTLNEIGVKNIPIINVYNKCDLFNYKNIPNEQYIKISARTGYGIENLLKQIDKTIEYKKLYRELNLSYNDISLIDIIHKYANVVEKLYTDSYLKLRLQIDNINWNILKKKLKEQNYEYR
jgi:GTP-binding protein HflX